MQDLYHEQYVLLSSGIHSQLIIVVPNIETLAEGK